MWIFLKGIKMDIRKLQKKVYEIARSKGWHEKRNPFAQSIANMHCELSEAFECWRKGDLASDHIAHFSGIEEEFADVIIRVLDTAEEMGLDICGAIEAKCTYNQTRSYRHGNKRA